MGKFSFSADNSAEQAVVNTSNDVIVANPFIQRQGNYFHTRQVQAKTTNAVCFSKTKGGQIWLPKSVVHVVEIYTGRVDVWVSGTFHRKNNKPYHELLPPVAEEGDLPSPFDGEKVLVSDPTIKFGGTRFITSCIARETERALAFFGLNDELVWLPKSQIHVEQHGQKICLWVSNWLVDEKRELRYLEE